MAVSTVPPPTGPVWVRVLLLLLLPVIAAGIYLEGQEYDRGLLELERGENPGQEAMALFPDELAGNATIGRPRSYHKDNLYEYINGHAEYYISAGFKGLAVGEYGVAGAQQPSLVINLYDMGKPLHAFGALMDELGPAAQPVEIGVAGFGEERAVNFIQGRYYVQVSTFGDETDVQAAAKAFAGQLAQQVPEGEELDLSFPSLGEPVETYFVKEDYRGYGVLDNALEKIFARDGEEITAFMITGTGEEVSALVQRMLEFLGEQEIAFEARERQGQEWYLVDDPYEGEWFFVPQGGRLIGVFAPPDEALLAAVIQP